MSPKLCVVGRVNTYFVLYTIVGKRGIVNLSHFAGFSLKYSFLLDKLNYNTLKVMIQFLSSEIILLTIKFHASISPCQIFTLVCVGQNVQS